ncbi:MAG: VOC family protein [Fastidiosipilaceae bacterium]|jgi:lactoylglutathione lyase
MHIQHITLRVKDLEKSIHFYQTITELSISRRFTHGEIELCFLSNGEGETEIELIHQPGGQTFEGKGMFICFASDQIEEKQRLADDLGLNPSPIQVPGDGTRYFYVYDPDGISIQLRSF